MEDTLSRASEDKGACLRKCPSTELYATIASR